MIHAKIEIEQFDKVDIIELYSKLFTLLEPLLKQDGSIVIFCRHEYITHLLDVATENNLSIGATIIWHKTNPMPQIRKKGYLSSIETIVWLKRWYKLKLKYTFNFSTQKEMHNLIEGPICMPRERLHHPTQKPEYLIKKLLMVHSNSGDLILDPFLGSGTTMSVCQDYRRSCIGIEIDSKYCSTARKRCFGRTFLDREVEYNYKTIDI